MCGNDISGNSFSDAVVKRGTSDWRVLLSPPHPPVLDPPRISSNEATDRWIPPYKTSLSLSISLLLNRDSK